MTPCCGRVLCSSASVSYENQTCLHDVAKLLQQCRGVWELALPGDTVLFPGTILLCSYGHGLRMTWTRRISTSLQFRKRIFYVNQRRVCGSLGPATGTGEERRKCNSCKIASARMVQPVPGACAQLQRSGTCTDQGFGCR